jgi:hypothetical protein
MAPSGDIYTPRLLEGVKGSPYVISGIFPSRLTLNIVLLAQSIRAFDEDNGVSSTPARQTLGVSRYILSFVEQC